NGCATPRWLASAVTCTSAGGSAANWAAAASTTSRPSPSTGSARTANPFTAISARFGPYSPGRQAAVRSPGQLVSNRSSALLDPVVKTTKASDIPASTLTAARPASSAGAAAAAAT